MINNTFNALETQKRQGLLLDLRTVQNMDSLAETVCLDPHCLFSAKLINIDFIFMRFLNENKSLCFSSVGFSK